MTKDYKHRKRKSAQFRTTLKQSKSFIFENFAKLHKSIFQINFRKTSSYKFDPDPKSAEIWINPEVRVFRLVLNNRKQPFHFGNQNYQNVNYQKLAYQTES